MTLDTDIFREGLNQAFAPDLENSTEILLETLRRSARRRTLISRVTTVVLYVIGLLLSSWVAAQVLDRSPPQKVIDEIVCTDGTTTKGCMPAVRAGSNLEDHITIIERTRSCALTLRWTIFDGANEIHVYEEKPFPASGIISITKPFYRPFAVAKNLSPGLSRFYIERVFKCPLNFIHEQWPIVVRSETTNFMILPEEKKKG